MKAFVAVAAVVVVVVVVVVAAVVASSIASRLLLHLSTLVCFQGATLSRNCVFLDGSENR